MMYQGGKYRIRHHIAKYIQSLKPDGIGTYLEPFCGSCSVGFEVKADLRSFSDLHAAVIAFWNAASGKDPVLPGWRPPDSVSEELYAQAKRGELPPAETAFIMTNCSFGGKWGGGYARQQQGVSDTKLFAARGIRTLDRDLKKIAGTEFEFLYMSYERAFELYADVVYCDPPYAGTTPYAGMPTFDTPTFWEAVRRKSEKSIVLVSEYNAPPDFEAVLTIPTYTSLHSDSGYSERRTEKVYRLRTGVPATAEVASPASAPVEISDFFPLPIAPPHAPFELRAA